MNLTVQRGERSVWDPPGLTTSLGAYDRHRLMTVAWGSALAAIGARRRGFAGGLMVMAGGVLAARAMMGRHDLDVARDWIDRALKERGWRRSDIVDDNVEDSFPASDPPQWTGLRATTREEQSDGR